MTDAGALGSARPAGLGRLVWTEQWPCRLTTSLPARRSELTSRTVTPSTNDNVPGAIPSGPWFLPPETTTLVDGGDLIETVSLTRAPAQILMRGAVVADGHLRYLHTWQQLPERERQIAERAQDAVAHRRHGDPIWSMTQAVLTSSGCSRRHAPRSPPAKSVWRKSDHVRAGAYAPVCYEEPRTRNIAGNRPDAGKTRVQRVGQQIALSPESPHDWISDHRVCQVVAAVGAVEQDPRTGTFALEEDPWPPQTSRRYSPALVGIRPSIGSCWDGLGATSAPTTWRQALVPTSFKEGGALLPTAVLAIVFAAVLVVTLFRLGSDPHGVEIGSTTQQVDEFGRAKDLLGVVVPLLGRP
jgi:hypothetical protein